MKSFSDPDTEFKIIRSDTPISVDGFKIGEPTGMIECEACGASHLNVDEIPHDEDCPQRFTKSWFWQNAALHDEPSRRDAGGD